MIVMLVLHKCSQDDRPVLCCNLRREDEDMIRVLEERINRKDSPPTPYEDPPCYDVAVQMEIVLTKRDLNVPGSS